MIVRTCTDTLIFVSLFFLCLAPYLCLRIYLEVGLPDRVWLRLLKEMEGVTLHSVKPLSLFFVIVIMQKVLVKF